MMTQKTRGHKIESCGIPVFISNRSNSEFLYAYSIYDLVNYFRSIKEVLQQSRNIIISSEKIRMSRCQKLCYIP